ncbi:uncharacterized protein MONBRDRAFT_32982 [Monosiga brevicollis MX1]|uniref:Ubiquitin carboxyl-terminal hydrolase n=1 Tax=Monosiga brevicollis TaxID=81824 RepID=A9V2V6_MONBE|nr:uncharacterized protein MONBRDRAFT_32982 [Monosiga brevicollis MX1]EDQ88079.1 predicted protein [Monosiga brevicollis MX1]|eukprot:XP_001747155.1 hypothetical protein [Monosiga brevicollis MX1]
MAGRWCLMESDPGVFTDLIEGVGVKGVQVEELWALDVDALKQLAPVYGLVFLFKFTPEAHKSETQPIDYKIPGLFFAHQVINNACATQAILSILLNAPDIELGEHLTGFKSFANELDPETAGLAISNSEELRTVHNSFSRQETFTMEEKVADKDDDVYHFIAYVPHGGRLYELDGLQRGPIDHGPVGEEWVETVVPVLQKRIERYTSTEIRFNLMAVCRDRREALEEEKENAESMALSLPEASPEAAEWQAKAAEFEAQLQQEHAKRQNWKDENRRRKHNYIPFILELMRSLAREKRLQPLVAEAKRKAVERLDQQKRTGTEPKTPKQ